MPRAAIRIGDRVVPTYLATGLAGVAAASLTLAALALARADLEPIVAFAIVPVAIAEFVAWSLLRRLVIGRENHVLWEGMALALGAAVLVAVVAGAPVLPYVDVAAVASAPLFAWGRVGCASTGCCHGVPSRLGILYPRECGVTGRRFPVQLVELVAWLGLLAVGVPLALWTRPGHATTWMLVGYGIVRLALEPLRGDVRWRLRGATEGTLLSWLAIVAGLALEARDAPVRTLYVAGGAVVLVALALVSARWWLGAPSRPSTHDRAELVAAGTRLANVTTPYTISAGRYIIAAEPRTSARAPTVLLRVSTDARLPEAEAALVLELFARAAGLARGALQPIEDPDGFHVELDASLPPAVVSAREPSYFDRPS